MKTVRSSKARKIRSNSKAISPNQQMGGDSGLRTQHQECWPEPRMCSNLRTECAGVATTLAEFAVPVDHLLRSRVLMERVDILCAGKQSMAKQVFELGERRVSSIRFGFDAERRRIESKSQTRGGSAFPGFRANDIFNPVISPQTPAGAKR